MIWSGMQGQIMHISKMHVRVMDVMVWNVREMHVLAEISGQGII
jgi:hypothetical protein